jgi:peptidoglycan/xylan/chitin deacetylase (PgdA/CDA1 family)
MKKRVKLLSCGFADRRWWCWVGVFIGLAIAWAGPRPQAGSRPAAAMAVTGSAPDLTIAGLTWAKNRVTLECITPQPDGQHEVLESQDLRRWQLVPAAAFEKTGGPGVRASIAGVSEAMKFYRVLGFGSSNAPVYVNIQIDAELDDTQGVRNLVQELEKRRISSTVYVSADYANRNAVLVTELFQKGFEIALHGYYTGEQLATMTYAEQKDLLTRAKKALEGCEPCGTHKPVTGFRPQYFSQNEDTFRILDELGLTYNSGFKLGQLYLPGHQWQAMPYRAEGHLFHVIPITTIPWEQDRVYLCDIACAQSLKWTSTQWRDALMTGLAQALSSRQPLVLLVHGWYTGDQVKYSYWQPFLDFLDAAQGRVRFVNSKELVDLAKQ